MSLRFDHDETLDEARARNIRDALYEDIGRCDWTAQLVPAGRRVQARVIVREAAVLCGREWFDGCVLAIDPRATVVWHYAEGADMSPDAPVCEITADARALLSAERPALNFLQLLSGTASATRRHVRAIEGASPNPKGCAILDTRKTLPGLRLAQKYAVRCGGGHNHRMGLWDAVLIKENHIAAAGSIAQAIASGRALAPGVMLEIEVESLDELREALAAKPDRILIDDFTPAQMREAVAIAAGSVPLEVSGGVSLETIGDIARTGVDFVSIGALTKHVRAIDFSLRVDG